MDNFDDDVILWLVPHESRGYEGAADATSLPANKKRFFAAARKASEQREIPREERGGTELPGTGRLENTDSLVVRFSHGARTSVGVVVGCGSNVNLSIPNLPGVSRYHLAITFDEQGRPIARDLGSTGGTKVTYDGEERQRLSDFDWPLVGPSIVGGRPPILNITDGAQFMVIVPNHDYAFQQHRDNVRQFRKGTGDLDNLLASLQLQSGTGTRFASG